MLYQALSELRPDSAWSEARAGCLRGAHEKERSEGNGI
jgi:hypothetical protein